MKKISGSRIGAGPVTERVLRSALFFAALLFAAGGFSALNSQTAARDAGLSRSMEQAIRLYNEGQDNDAMDRFMNILVKGTPSEKALANEYISKITNRIGTGVNTLNTQTPGDEMPEEAGAAKDVPVSKQPELAGGLTPSEEEGAALDDPQVQKDLIADRISQKIAGMRHNLLLELNKLDAIKIYMGDPLPRAITLDPKYFFANDTVFKAAAAPALKNLAGLLFTLGKASVLVLPEGTVEGDVKVRSIRQAIALNSYLVARGLSQSRMDVNLTGTDIKFPRELTSISGLVILLDYDKVPRLTEPEDARSDVPKISLGVYPTELSVQKNEGAIVEFSVFKSPAGPVSWKFEIYSVRADNALLLLQKMEDVGPLCRQSYWNGRKNFFGVPYAPGKYIFSITATDVQGRESNLRRFLVIRPGPGEAKATASGKAAAKPVVASKTITKFIPVRAAGGKKFAAKKGITAAAGKAGSKASRAAALGKAAGKTSRAAAAAKKSARAALAKKTAPDDGAGAVDAADAQTEFSGQVSYKIFFQDETAVITENSEKKLAQVAETMNYYPMAQVKLIGYAYSGEANPQTMAQSRVDYVATRLSGKYNIGSDRMESSAQISESPKGMVVEIKMLGKQ
jgi:outer membrane protein OmpA-like peptidoglycan-associated protein